MIPMLGITKMKDGSTHLATKPNIAVDLSSGALLAVTLQGADQGDTTTIHQTLAEAGEAVAELIEHEAVTAPAEEPKVNLGGIEKPWRDKGYQQRRRIEGSARADCRSYIPEPDRGPRKWTGKRRAEAGVRQPAAGQGRSQQEATSGKRTELTERSMAHMYETGGMRRVHLKGRDNILKRLLVHAGASNLALILRKW